MDLAAVPSPGLMSEQRPAPRASYSDNSGLAPPSTATHHPPTTAIVEIRPNFPHPVFPVTAQMQARSFGPTSTEENRKTLARNFLSDFNISAEMRLLMFMHGRVHTLESVCRKLETEIAAAREEYAALTLTYINKQEELMLVRTGKIRAMLPMDFTGPTVADFAREIALGAARLKVLADLQTRKEKELEDTREKLETKMEQCAIAEKRWAETKGRVKMRGDGEDVLMGGVA